MEVDAWVRDFAVMVKSYLKWKEENKKESGLNEKEKRRLIEKYISKQELSDSKEALQIKKAISEFNFENIFNPIQEEANDAEKAPDGYLIITSFCSIGFYDAESQKLYSIGKFSAESNLDSFDFMIHSAIEANDLYKTMIGGMGWEFIKSERDVDVKEYYEFRQESKLRNKLETMQIKNVDYLIKKLNDACYSFLLEK